MYGTANLEILLDIQNGIKNYLKMFFNTWENYFYYITNYKIT